MAHGGSSRFGPPQEEHEPPVPMMILIAMIGLAGLIIR
ncbi:hypothetical protein RLEG3_20940 [Rhizobium leguminosarum bv. trifolii WSM1689]|nr:hypothetical protein RLEG3_20940 [Rhizobium leguminosarum bv. trifolii WSM1689]